jgi:hypothetical protein
MLSIQAGDIPASLRVFAPMESCGLVKMKKQEPLRLFGEGLPYFLAGASLLEDSR